MNIESIKSIMDAFDPAALFPPMDTMLGRIEVLTRLAVLVGPVVLLAQGLYFLFFLPRHAAFSGGYRFFWGMSRPHVWREMQRLAALVFTALGAVLTLSMGLVCLLNHGAGAMKLVNTAAICLIWEAVLTAAACITINVIIMKRYDKSGRRRPRRSADSRK